MRMAIVLWGFALLVAQATGFAPSPLAVGCHAMSPPGAGWMPASRGAPRAAELRPRAPHVGGGTLRMDAACVLSCDAAHRRAVAPVDDAPLVSGALSRFSASLRCVLNALFLKVIVLASLVAVAPSLAGASPGSPSGSATAEAAAPEDSSPTSSKSIKIVTVLSAGGLAVHTLLSHRQCKQESRRWGHS